MTSERSAKITIGGLEYELILTTKATKEIAKRYGGLEDLGEKLMKAMKKIKKPNCVSRTRMLFYLHSLDYMLFPSSIADDGNSFFSCFGSYVSDSMSKFKFFRCES